MSDWAVILGATGVSGAAVARAVAADPGLSVWGVHRGRHLDVADALGADLRALGRDVELAVGDAADADAVARWADALAARIPPRSVRLLLHALAGAGVGHLVYGHGERLHPKQYARTFDVMAHSFPWWCQALVDRDLLAPGARLLALTNPLLGSVVRGTALVTASKAALHNYVRHLAYELGPLGYGVNVIEFGAVLSPAMRHTFAATGPGAVAEANSRIGPARRLCSVDELGGLVSLLLDPRAAWFNGSHLDFTGAEFQSLYDALLHPQRS